VGFYQGDQIGRIFTYWAFIFFGQFVYNYRSSLNMYLFFFHVKSCALGLKKNWLGYILGDFFANSSGHPDFLLGFKMLFKTGFVCELPTMKVGTAALRVSG
jgi:hypothetical protein